MTAAMNKIQCDRIEFSVTSAANEAIKKYLEENDAPEDAGLRVGIGGGGCSGFSYVIEVGTLQDGDHVFNSFSEKIFIDRKSALFLDGCELDFKTNLFNVGFSIKNPRAGKVCGCGESFGVT